MLNWFHPSLIRTPNLMVVGRAVPSALDHPPRKTYSRGALGTARPTFRVTYPRGSVVNHLVARLQ
jgi:hypothetical protein